MGEEYSEKNPLFSIIIPTKNRSHLIQRTVAVALRQSFSDFEVVLVDNDDTTATSIACADCSDPRFVYIRTGGLSMPDNWQVGINNSRGQYILLIEDKMMLRTFVLEVLYNYIKKNNNPVICWRYSSFSELRSAINNEMPKIEFEDVRSEMVLDSLINCDFNFYNNHSPRGLNTCIERSLLLEIQDKVLGNFYRPISPDFMASFLLLNYCTSIACISEPLVLLFSFESNATTPSRDLKNNAIAFLKEMGLKITDTYSHVPLKVLSVRNNVFNDYYRACEQMNINPKPLSIAKYFAFVYEEVKGYCLQGYDFMEDLETLRRYPESFSPSVRNTLCETMQSIDNKLTQQPASCSEIFLKKFARRAFLYIKKNIFQRCKDNLQGEEIVYLDLDYKRWKNQ